MEPDTPGMSLATLPPVYMAWTQQDLESLCLDEIELLFAHLTRKLYDVENQFLEETAFFKRNKEKILRKEKLRKKKQLLSSSRP